jgi:hypothetical protein
MTHPSERMGMAEASADHVASALKAAEELTIEGCWREAIDLLTRANRQSRDAAIESRLVRLRHDAFDDLARIPTPPWPPDLPNGLPLGSPPEVNAVDLDSSMLTRSIMGAGCLLVRGLVSPPAVEQLVDGTERAFAILDLLSSGRADENGAPWFERFVPIPRYDRGIPRDFVRNAGGILAADSPRLLFDLLEIVGSAGVPDLVEAHLREQPALSAKKTTLRRVTKEKSNAAWHQDGAFMGTDIRTVNLWLALSHCGDDAPGLDILPRRLDHIVETGTLGAIFDWAAAPDMVERAAGGTPLCRPIFEPGDALLFDHLFMHRTAANPEMAKDRHGVEMWFFAPSLYPPSQIPLVV